jgi:hypothetical protein
VDGVTPEGTAVPFGSILEVKIGTGSPMQLIECPTATNGGSAVWEPCDRASGW